MSLSATAFTTTAFAGGGDGEKEVLPVEPTGEVSPEPVCANNMTACAGKAPEKEEPELPVKEGKGSMDDLLVLLIVVLVGGMALYYFKFRKPKADVSGSTDLSEYDFGDEDEPENEETEDEEAE